MSLNNRYYVIGLHYLSKNSVRKIRLSESIIKDNDNSLNTTKPSILTISDINKQFYVNNESFTEKIIVRVLHFLALLNHYLLKPRTTLSHISVRINLLTRYRLDKTNDNIKITEFIKNNFSSVIIPVSVNLGKELMTIVVDGKFSNIFFMIVILIYIEISFLNFS